MDTDLLVLLWTVLAAKLTTYNTPHLTRKWIKTSSYILGYCDIQKALGAIFFENIVFVHAFLGCGDTSRMHSIGKPMALKTMLKENLEFMQYGQVSNKNEKGPLCLYKAGAG